MASYLWAKLLLAPVLRLLWGQQRRVHRRKPFPRRGAIRAMEELEAVLDLIEGVKR